MIYVLMKRRSFVVVSDSLSNDCWSARLLTADSLQPLLHIDIVGDLFPIGITACWSSSPVGIRDLIFGLWPVRFGQEKRVESTSFIVAKLFFVDIPIRECGQSEIRISSSIIRRLIDNVGEGRCACIKSHSSL